MRKARLPLALVLVPCALAVGAPGGPAPGPQVLSGFFGLDDALPRTANLLCRGAAGTDGLPVVFREELRGQTLQPTDFAITTKTGATLTPRCATLAPSIEEDEDRTVLLIGQLGSTSDPPVRMDVVDALETESGVNLAGSGVAVIGLEAGPTLAFAETMGASASRADRCATTGGRTQRVRVTWTGGIRAPGGAEVGAPERSAYRVTLERQGRRVRVVPFALTDLNDNDNNHVLCVASTGRPQAVSMSAGVVQDPRGDLNPVTSVALAPRPG